MPWARRLAGAEPIIGLPEFLTHLFGSEKESSTHTGGGSALDHLPSILGSLDIRLPSRNRCNDLFVSASEDDKDGVTGFR
jgi:hypothetical protein